MIKHIYRKRLGAIEVEKNLVYLGTGTECSVQILYWKNGLILGTGTIERFDRYTFYYRKNGTIHIKGKDSNGKYEYK